jgi:two-component system NtrC family sensor kinase
LTYLLPIAVLAIYFYIQYGTLVSQSQQLHLRAIAENQANTLDLFLSERLVNLSNLIDDPKFQAPPESQTMAQYLTRLKKDSETFVDLGFFDSSGVQSSYAGPFPALEKRDYSSESWFRNLLGEDRNFVITDIYLGFRRQPHFTIGVSRIRDDRFMVLRATLDPRKIYEYISSLEDSTEVYTSIINSEGLYQVVPPRLGAPLEASLIMPEREPRLGVGEADIGRDELPYAYSWLRNVDWALIVQPSSEGSSLGLNDFRATLAIIALALTLIIFLIILNRANRLVKMQQDSDRIRAELEHAAKLASVGELAAGIAHEINNPLAVISEEAGLIKDLTSAEFGSRMSMEELAPHLDTIQQSAFRARDITHKLLRFVRKTDMNLQPHDLHPVVDGVVDGLLGTELAVSNIEIVRDYTSEQPVVVVDANQLQQVVLNLINNSVDAIDGQPGKITIATEVAGRSVRLSVSDTGKGMSAEQLDRIFMPFYTTKEVGKGTGLGLSVSYGIIKSLGGKIEVESEVGKGSRFTIILPKKNRHE